MKERDIMGEIRAEKDLGGGRFLRVVKGSITRENVDAIANAANSRLQHGGGVAGVIVREGGNIIQEESNRIGGCPVGRAVVTGAGKLISKYVIHAVGPVWEGGGKNEEKLLESAMQSVLERAEEKKIESLSLPAISSGIFGFPKPLCAKILTGTALEYFQKNLHSSVKEVRFCNIDEETVSIFEKEFSERFGSPETRKRP